MRFFYDNLIDYSGVLLLPSSAQSTLPASNVANEHRKRVWRTGTSAAAENLVIDLGSAKAVTAVILLDHTLTASDTLIKLEGHTTNAWGAPTFTQALTWASGTIAQVFASQTLRWWRISFTKSAAGETRDLGRVFLGTYYETPIDPDADGYDEELNDPSRKTKSLGGQTYTEILEKFGVPAVKFSAIDQTMRDNLKTIFDAVGEAVSFFVQVQSTSPLNKVWYVKLRRAFKTPVKGMDSTLLWDVSLDLEEQL
jgi:hypothetical protein